MSVRPGREKRGGTLSQQRRYGSKVSETRTYTHTIPDSLSLDSALNLPGFDLAASSEVRVIDRKADGNLMVEVAYSTEPFALNQIQWEVTSVSLQERTTIDVNGDPITVSYPPSLDYAETGFGFVSWQYSTYADQGGEADVYIVSQEITGVQNKIIRNGQIVNSITGMRGWAHTLNSTPFFGHPRGCVLCMGVDFRQVGRRPNGDWLCELRYKFVSRPGTPLSGDGVGGGGWNTWAYWKDPNSGMIPYDIWSKKDDGAVNEIKHYRYLNHAILYTVSV